MLNIGSKIKTTEFDYNTKIIRCNVTRFNCSKSYKTQRGLYQLNLNPIIRVAHEFDQN